MASAAEDESTPGRRTRSGRKASSSQPIASPARSTRRTYKKQIEQINEQEQRLCATLGEDPSSTDQIPVIHDSDIKQDMLAEDAHDIILNQNKENVSEIHDNDAPNIRNLVEEIVKEDNDECIIYEEVVNPQRAEDVDMFDIPEEQHGNIETVTISAVTIDDKSSSFPFGNVVQSETSEEVQNEEIGESIDETGDLVESSLLASLAGDNANSLPSVGGGEEVDSKKDDFEEKIIEKHVNAISEKMESDDSFSQPALAEEIIGEVLDTSNATIINTEMVSEDELPILTKPEINDAEEVSDDELPAPQRAELPADAEVISEDELPTTNVDKKSQNSSPKTKDTCRKKRKADEAQNDHEKYDEKLHKSSADIKEDVNERYNPMSPTGESNDSPPTEKKAKIVEEEEFTCDHMEKKKESREKEKEKKKLPDLDKYWRSVKEDPADFTGWTYLLQYVDNESDAEAAREAYDAFLSHYPYCYGYWRKYADYEKRKGIKANCNTVFERGLEAIPLSVDLWIHYLSHVKSNHSEDEKYIRSQFERAIDSCGLEFRSDKLWDAYIKWENDNKHYDHVVHIYDRLLAIPTQGYSGHFDNFQDLINQHSITSTISPDELLKFRSELRVTSGSSRTSKSKERRTEFKEKEQKELKIGEKEKDCKDEPSCRPYSKELEHSSEAIDPDSEEVSSHKEDKLKEQHISDLNTLTENEISAIKDRVISIRRKVHKNTVAAVTARWTYEEGIKRPYFHVKPLERCQLKNWKEYLEFEIEKGDRKRILVLFERCLIACALYDEFWLKMIRYLETLLNDQPDIAALTSDIYRRACEIHHPDKPSLHLMWSAFEECQNNFNKAADVLVNLEKKCPSLLQVAYRRINLERRRGDINKCKELYEQYITTAKNKTIAGSLAIKYARFLNKICNDIDAGLRVLRQILEKDPSNTRVALQMIDLALQRSKVDEDEVVLIMEKFMARENIDPEQKVLFAQRKVEFLEDFGSSAKGLQDAQRGLQMALSKANEAKKKRESSPSRKTSSTTVIKEAVTNSLAQSTAYNNGVPSTNANYNYNSSNSAYSAYGQNNNAYQQSYDGYYNQWQYGSGYSGYSQWSGYGNYY